MKQELRAIFKGPVVFYPLLFAAFPILFLYAHNISETSASQIWLPLVISVAAALVLWTVLSLTLRSLAKAGFATAIFLILFFSYGRFCELLDRWDAFVLGHGHLLPAVLLVFGYCVYFIGRARSDFRITTRMLNVTAVALIAINLFNIGSYQVKAARLSADAPVEATEHTAVATSATEHNTLPDIYFIILDEYAHPDTMREWYDYDNSEFIDSLEDKGFFVAHESRTRTGSTAYSIASTLNMEYVSLAAPLEIVKQMIATNKVVGFLKQRGYGYAYFQINHWWRGTYGVATDLPIDVQSLESDYLMTDFSRLLWHTTMLRPFYNYIYGTEYIRSWRNGLLDTLSHLETMPDIEGPKIVIAHLICPHEPFVFGPDGEIVDIQNVSNYEDKQFYLGQYIFMTRELERLVEVILEESSAPPIIVIQSDHGIRTSGRLVDVGEDEWRKIFNAYYLPGTGTEELWPSISPVNSFRVIFNRCFGASYEMLED